MKTYVATKNDGKLKELREIFAGSPLELDIFPTYDDVEETADTYADNATIKARALFEQLRIVGMADAVLADDSGIEVDALDGRPGVLSARYMPGASWVERLHALLSEVGVRPDQERGAKFVCSMALLLPDGREIEAYGEVRGRLMAEAAGAHGFGYDPVFFYEPFGKTFAEVSQTQKNRVSHRYNAAQSLLWAYKHL